MKQTRHRPGHIRKFRLKPGKNRPQSVLERNKGIDPATFVNYEKPQQKVEKKPLEWKQYQAIAVQPQIRQSFCSNIVNDALYVIGGMRGSGGRCSQVEKFDLNKKEWIR